jgi:hypothetical protein
MPTVLQHPSAITVRNRNLPATKSRRWQALSADTLFYTALSSAWRSMATALADSIAAGRRAVSDSAGRAVRPPLFAADSARRINGSGFYFA